MSHIYDLVGIGFGPANIALAAYLDETSSLDNILFLESSDEPIWQSEMLFENALDIHSNVQNIPHRDLATLRSPRSRYTFLNYLHETGRLLEHLNMDLLMPLRPDYASYIKWVRQQLSQNLRTGVRVSNISLAEVDGQKCYSIASNDEVIHAKHIALGTGRPPFIPEVFKPVSHSARLFHLNRYKTQSERLLGQGARKFAVIGSSQSAVEIVLHLSKVDPSIEVHSIFRRYAYPLKDTNPFMSEVFFPEFTDLYYKADEPLKRRIDQDVYRTNYGACDMDVLEELYRQIYYDKMHGKNQVHLRQMSEAVHAEETADALALDIHNYIDDTVSREEFDGVILATGFRNIGPSFQDIKIPSLLDGMSHALQVEGEGNLAITRDYMARFRDGYEGYGFIAMNGLCEKSHGMGDAGSLSLLSIRAQDIADQILEAEGLTHALEANDQPEFAPALKYGS